MYSSYTQVSDGRVNVVKTTHTRVNPTRLLQPYFHEFESNSSVSESLEYSRKASIKEFRLYPVFIVRLFN